MWYYLVSKGGVIMLDKPFRELTKDEATAIAKRIVGSSGSEEEVRRCLTEAGFNGNAAAVYGHGGMFMAMVWGPKGEVINA